MGIFSKNNGHANNMSDIEKLEEYLKNGLNGEISKLTNYAQRGVLHVYTNDPLCDENESLEKKRVLTPTSTGDHILCAAYQGSTDIVAFDINQFSKFLARLKIATLMCYEYDQFEYNYNILLHGYRSINVEMIDKINIERLSRMWNSIRKFLSKEDIVFWETYFNIIRKEENKYTLFDFHNPLQNICFNHYNDRKKYEELKKKIVNVNINYIDCDVITLPNRNLGTFDVINASNILECMHTRKMQTNTLNNLHSMLNENGRVIIYSNMLYMVQDGLAKHQKLYNAEMTETSIPLVSRICYTKK